MKNLIKIIIVLVFSLPVFAQHYFQDVTKTHLPSGLTDHSMDAEFIDVDEDGDLDIVVAVEFGRNSLLINDGRGNFTHSDALTTKEHDSEDIAIADYNMDGHMDIFFVSEDDFINELYFGDGKGNFTPANDNIPVKNRSNAVITEDINDDGVPDIIIGNSIGGNSPGGNTILINDGKGNFIDESEKRLPPIKDDTQDLIMKDVNGDGFLDLLIANEGENKMYFNNGDGTFSDESSRLPIRENVREVTREVDLGDLDGDGDLDMVYFNNGGDKQNRILMNDGKGNFSDETEKRAPKVLFRTWDGAIYDLNDDGFLDIVTASSSDDVSGELYEVYINDGKGNFIDKTSEIFPASVKGSGWDVEAADLNGDGVMDLYLCARSNNKDGTWSQDILLFGVPGKATRCQKK